MAKKPPGLLRMRQGSTCGAALLATQSDPVRVPFRGMFLRHGNNWFAPAFLVSWLTFLPIVHTSGRWRRGNRALPRTQSQPAGSTSAFTPKGRKQKQKYEPRSRGRRHPVVPSSLYDLEHSLVAPLDSKRRCSTTTLALPHRQPRPPRRALPSRATIRLGCECAYLIHDALAHVPTFASLSVTGALRRLRAMAIRQVR